MKRTVSYSRRFCPLAIIAATMLLIAESASFAAPLTSSVGSIELKDAFAGRQLLISDSVSDLTRQVKYSSSNPAVASVDVHGYVSPTGNGSSTITVLHGAEKLEIPVKVIGFGNGRSVDFKTKIVPMLSRLGCNAGGCHGKASGQNGFKLSLFGFDAAFDHDAITREARGRRVFPASRIRVCFFLKRSARFHMAAARN